MVQQKPTPWVWDQNKLEPQFRSLAYGLIGLVPFWDKGVPVDIINDTMLHPRPTPIDPDWGEDSEWGLFRSFGSSIDEPEWPSAERFAELGQAEHTYMVVTRLTAFPGTVAYILSKGDGATWWALSLGTSTWTFSWDDAVSKETRAMTATIDEWQVLLAGEQAGNYHASLNNVEDGDTPISGHFSAATNETIIGSKSWSKGNDEYTGDIAFIALWDRSLTIAERALVTDNPYGLLIPRVLTLPTGGAPAVTDTVLGHYGMMVSS
jgi:hypothetical protein